MTSILTAKAIVVALPVIPLGLALVLTALLAREKPDATQSQRNPWTFWSFAFYLTLLAVITLAPQPFSMANGSSGTNFIPFRSSIQCFVPTPGQPSTTQFCFRTIGGNIAMFIPLGLMLPLVFGKRISALHVCVVALVASSAIELLQYAGSRFGSGRWSDVDDVLFNLIGAVSGYAIYALTQRISRKA